MNYLSLGLLWFLSMSLTLLFLLLWPPTREYLMPDAAKARAVRMAQRRANQLNVRNGKTAEKGIVEPPYAKEVSYYMCHQWSEQAIEKGLMHDFEILGREKVLMHYHSMNKECNDRCKTVERASK